MNPGLSVVANRIKDPGNNLFNQTDDDCDCLPDPFEVAFAYVFAFLNSSSSSITVFWLGSARAAIAGSAPGVLYVFQRGVRA